MRESCIPSGEQSSTFDAVPCKRRSARCFGGSNYTPDVKFGDDGCEFEGGPTVEGWALARLKAL